MTGDNVESARDRFLVFGLGNPGKKYARTRHNAGFLVADALAERHGWDFKQGRGDFVQADGLLNGHRVFVIKPLTFMNNSGLAVRQAVDFFKQDLSHILVIVDDFQIPLGALRLRKSGSDGGHNGLASIISLLGTKQFPRLRIGIGPDHPIDNWVSFVLSEFNRAEWEILEKIIPMAADAVEVVVKEGIDRAMNRYNRRAE